MFYGQHCGVSQQVFVLLVQSWVMSVQIPIGCVGLSGVMKKVTGLQRDVVSCQYYLTFHSAVDTVFHVLQSVVRVSFFLAAWNADVV